MSIEIEDKEALQERERRLSIESARASRARAVLEDEGFVEAVAACRDHYHRLFATSDLDDDKGRYHARACLYALEDVLTRLTSVMQTGEMAEIEKVQIEQSRRIRDADPGEASWQ